MLCKFFQSRKYGDLELAVNEWLERNPVTPDSMRFEFSTVLLQDEVEYIVIYTLVLFYVPMVSIR